MNKQGWQIRSIAILVLASLWSPMTVAIAADSKTAAPTADSASLAQKSQNPIADMMSLPIQFNVYSGGALDSKTMSVVNLQPVIPARLNQEWNLITRAVIPMISAPADFGRVYDSGDSTLSFFFSPRGTGKTTWGIGPIFQLPTAGDSTRGSQTWGIGPTAVFVKVHKQWVYGGLANYVTSVGNSPSGLRTNQLFVQPFVNYNLPKRRGMAISFSPGITCDFTRQPGDQWTVPLGLGISQILKVGAQPVSLSLGVYYNVVRTSAAPEWNYRFQFTLLFP